jgi:hypothetical protein
MVSENRHCHAEAAYTGRVVNKWSVVMCPLDTNPDTVSSAPPRFHNLPPSLRTNLFLHFLSSDFNASLWTRFRPQQSVGPGIHRLCQNRIKWPIIYLSESFLLCSRSIVNCSTISSCLCPNMFLLINLLPNICNLSAFLDVREHVSHTHTHTLFVNNLIFIVLENWQNNAKITLHINYNLFSTWFKRLT